MAAADTAKMIATLELKDQLSKGLKTASGNVGKFESRWDRLGTKLKAGLAIGAAGIAGLVGANVKAGLDSLVSLENAVSSVDGAIAQVGSTWTTTGADIAKIANRIEADVEAAFDDKDIIAASETLIRYGKVSEKNLEPALEVMTDLAARTGDVEGAASLLAKALADPAKAAGKLARSGVVLTKAQQETIKAMVEANDTAGAQAFLLAELEKTTRGAAAASRGPAADAQNTLNDALEDGQRLLAEGFLPVITRVRDLLREGLSNPQTKTFLRDFGKGLAGGLDQLISIAKSLPWGAIADSLRIAGEGAKTILGAFTSLPPWVQTAVLTGWGLNKVTGGFLTDIASGLIKGVLGINAGVVNLKAATVIGGGGGIPGGAGGAGAAGGLAGVGLGAAVAGGGILAAIQVGITQIANSEFVKHGIKSDLRAAGMYDFAGQIRNLGQLVQIGDQLLNRKTDEQIAEAQRHAAAALTAQRHGEQVVRTSAQETIAATRAKLDEAKRVMSDAGLKAQRAGERAAGATNTGTNRIVAAIYAARPVISVTNVTRTYNRISRDAETSGDRDGANRNGRTIY